MRNFIAFSVMLLCTDVFAATFSTVSVPLCGYGLYNNGSECVKRTNKFDKCPDINGLGAYPVVINENSFNYRTHFDAQCLGTHTLYEYDVLVVKMLPTHGTFRTVGAPKCGYGEQRLDGVCVKRESDEGRGRCKNGFYKSGANQSSFMSVFANGGKCLGTHTVYEYADNLSPIYNGILVSVGAPLRASKNMQSVPCSTNPDNYYQITASDSSVFSFPNMANCDTNSSKYSVKSNCRDIDVNNLEQLKQNTICGVLCDSGVYTNLGMCADGYCSIDGKNKRIFINNNGVVQSVPLYSSKNTTPSVNVRFNGSSNQVCYMNLVDAPTDKSLRVEYNGIKYRAID